MKKLPCLSIVFVGGYSFTVQLLHALPSTNLSARTPVPTQVIPRPCTDPNVRG